MQITASLRRLDYSKIIVTREHDLRRCDPNSFMFDPERAAVIHARSGNLDEAIWLIFLATHFGKHRTHGWRRLANVYSGLGLQTWTWIRVSKELDQFRIWLDANETLIGGGQGNHRKYESLKGTTGGGTGAVVSSYTNWIGPNGSHALKIAQLVSAGGNHPHSIFDEFFKDMKVTRFGRLGKFDFLAMLGRLGLAPIEPGLAYLDGATGPLRGARLLFGGSIKSCINASDLEQWISELDEDLCVGMQTMEDALCNWQKSPNKFIHFRG